MLGRRQRMTLCKVAVYHILTPRGRNGGTSTEAEMVMLYPAQGAGPAP